MKPSEQVLMTVEKNLNTQMAKLLEYCFSEATKPVAGEKTDDWPQHMVDIAFLFYTQGLVEAISAGSTFNTKYLEFMHPKESSDEQAQV